MIYLHVFWAFFIANILGYGGGPATIPLIQQQVVDQYGWMTNAEFVDLLAVANALPGPIATKLGAFVGFEQAGWIGLTIATLATIVPSAVALVILLTALNQFKESITVKGMTLLVQPVIAVLMIHLTWEFGVVSFESAGIIQSVIIGLIALFAIVRWRVHPAILILVSFIYGGAVIPFIQ